MPLPLEGESAKQEQSPPVRRWGDGNVAICRTVGIIGSRIDHCHKLPRMMEPDRISGKTVAW